MLRGRRCGPCVERGPGHVLVAKQQGPWHVHVYVYARARVYADMCMSVQQRCAHVRADWAVDVCLYVCVYV